MLIEEPFILLSAHQTEPQDPPSLVVDTSLLGETFYCDRNGTQLSPFSIHARVGDPWMVLGNLEDYDPEPIGLISAKYVLRAFILVRLTHDADLALYEKSYTLMFNI